MSAGPGGAPAPASAAAAAAAPAAPGTRIVQVPVGHMRNFSYVVADPGSRLCAIVDPSWDLDLVYRAVEESGCRPRYIVNTHHHFDHTTGNEEAAARTGAEIVRHEASPLGGDSTVSGGDTVEIGGTRLGVIHTPGHSEDSICLVAPPRGPGGAVVTGDTLFVGGCGRIDLPGGSARDLYRSLFGALAGLDGALAVYPGHDYGPSPTSTLARERRTNFALQPRTEDEFVAAMGGR